MTNTDAWNHLTKDLPTPQAWIDLGYLGLISIAMERRVWFGSGGREVYPNLFMAFVGPPGKGKSFVLTEMRRVLSGIRDENRPMVVQDGELVPRCYFNFSPDTTTFEGALTDISRNTKLVEIDGRRKSQAPYAVLLSELNSFIRLDHSQIPKALLKFYDCEDYEYKPKHGPPDIIRNSAMQVIGGATMEFLEDGYKKGIFNDGFTARFIWSFENRKRHSNFEVSTVSDEQLRCREQLIEWIGRLTKVSGQLSYSEETSEFLQQWYSETHTPAEDAAPRHLQDYMARKAMHLRKLAICVHFAENDSRVIGIESFKKALAILERLEPNLAAFKVIGRNTMAKHQLRVLDYISTRDGVAFNELLINFNIDMKRDELQETLNVYMLTGQLKEQNGKYYANRR